MQNQIRMGAAVMILGAISAGAERPAAPTNDVQAVEKIEAQAMPDAPGEEFDVGVDIGVTTREDIADEVKGDFELLDQRFRRLRDESAATGEQAQKKWNERWESLQQKHDNLQELLNREAEVNGRTWLEMSPSLREARDELKNALDEAETYYTDTVRKHAEP